MKKVEGHSALRSIWIFAAIPGTYVFLLCAFA